MSCCVLLRRLSFTTGPAIAAADNSNLCVLLGVVSCVGLRVHRSRCVCSLCPAARFPTSLGVAVHAAWPIKLCESFARKPRLTVYRAPQVRQRQGKLNSKYAKTICNFWSVFLDFLAMCQFVFGKVVFRASSHTYACMGIVQKFQKIHWEKIELVQGRSHGTNFWRVVQKPCF